MKTIGIVTIGEAAARSGLAPKTIRFYEESGIIKRVTRGENRYRGYSESDVQTLCFIRRARALGFSLKDVAGLLDLYRNNQRASRDVKRLALKHVAELDRKLAEMTAIRNTIAALAERCDGNDQPDCPILDGLGAHALSPQKCA
jgi:MerR family copper efflux transcriptional regulator